MLKHHNWQSLIFILLVLAIISYIVYNYVPLNSMEKFENSVNYLRLSETYIDDNDKNLKLDLLYANYSGEEVNKDLWENKTLSQCMDTCNKLEGCVGFSRSIVGDNEQAICYPRTAIDKCHSYRKGSFAQRQNALAYNTYVKSSTEGALTKCLGDSHLTLGRTVYIKSYAHPDKYIGLNTNGEIGLVPKNQSGIDFGKAVQFSIDAGLEGSGTVSFRHLATGKYLYRSSEGVGDMIIGKSLELNKITTEEKQRASFHLEDGLSNNVVIKCVPLTLENAARYVSVYPKNTAYLNVRTLSDLENVDTEEGKTKKQLKKAKSITFEIVDEVIHSSVIDNRKYITDIMEPVRTYPATPNMVVSTDEVVVPKIRKYPNENIIQSFADVNTAADKQKLSNSMDDYNYYKLMSGHTEKKDLQNYIQDKYLNNPAQNEIRKMEGDLFAKLNMSNAKMNLEDATKKAQERYNTLRQMNMTIEDMIAKENRGINGVNERLINNVDKMKIKDLSSDYFFLKNLMS